MTHLPYMAAGHLYAAETSQGGSPFGALLPVVLFAGIYFVMIRPQQRRVKEHRALTSQVIQGDKIVTTGGIVGTVRRVDDTTMQLQVADNVVLTLDRGSVLRKLEN